MMMQWLFGRLARHGLAFILIVAVAANIGIYLHFSQSKTQFVQRGVNHRGELLLYDIKEIVRKHLETTRGLAAYVYSELLVHHHMSEWEEARTLLREFVSIHTGALAQAAVYLPDSREPIQYTDPNMSGLPLLPLGMSKLPTIQAGQMLLTVIQSDGKRPLLRTFHKVCAREKCGMLVVDIAIQPVLEQVLQAADKRQLSVDMSISVSVHVPERGDVSSPDAVIPLYVRAPDTAVSSSIVWRGSFELAGRQFFVNAVAMPKLIESLVANVKPMAIWGLISGGIILLLLILLGYNMLYYSKYLRQKARKRLQGEQCRLKSIMDYVQDAILFATVDGAIKHSNPAACILFGYRGNEWDTLMLDDLVLWEGESQSGSLLAEVIQSGCRTASTYEVQARRKNGVIFPAELVASGFQVMGEQQVTLMLRDLSEQKNVEAKLEWLSGFDAVTKLPNRSLFTDRLDKMMALVRREKRQLGLLVLDIDRFKEVNDALGFLAGDQVLQITTDRLLGLVRESDSTARLDSDEFAIMLPDAGKVDAMQMAEKVKEALCLPYEVGGQAFLLGVNIGVAVFPNDGEDAETLVKHATTAMHYAKKRDLNIHCFESVMEDRLKNRLVMEQELVKALDEGQIRLYYQSKHQLVDSKIIGLEGLVRWQHPEKGLITPDRFVPLAEESGLIHSMLFVLLRQACQDAKTWRKIGVFPGRIGLNLSASQLIRKGLAKEILTTIQESGAKPEWFEIEITETAAMSDLEMSARMMQELVDGGVSIAIDDFGTGYSSLAYLKHLPADWLKIDMAFIHNLPDDKDDAAIVHSTIAMAHALNKKVIAEGVETEIQLEFLRHEGCDAIQGYLFSRPLSVDETRLHLKRYSQKW